MHGREEGESRKRVRHMWSVASRGSVVTVGVDSDSTSSVNSFLKDGRKISVGDCALFKPPNDSPPFIGFIRSLSLDKDNNLRLRVNWLYRPAEVALGKGVVLEAAPNEVFYSFHRDETLAASLLHPCKVAFLPKGAELPSGVSSFVCRRVYDITNKCLWWLTDKDYINDRQEEVDQLLCKSRSEMHPTVQQHQVTNSPRSVNGVATKSPLKHSSDSMQNSGTYASQPKGKKREIADQAHGPMKRERLMKDGDTVLSRSESSVKSELTKIIDKGGLIDIESVEKLVQLMQADQLQKKVDFGCRSMLAGIIACTEKFDCLTHFVQLWGLTVLDGWLQEVNKGKVGYSGSPKDGDKSVEDFLFVLLRALDKLPINLNALQTCNIGKSVNNLRSHKNVEIQKKARSLVDMWKKRVEFEMNIKDSKSTSNQVVPWPGGRSRNLSGSSDTAIKSSVQLAPVKSDPLKLVHEDITTKDASMFQMSTNHKHGQVMVSSSDIPHAVTKEEKNSSSSQSHTTSQCSSDLAKNIARSGKEDAGCSTAGSKSVKKASDSSRHRKSPTNAQNKTHFGVQISSRNSPLHGISPSEKFSESIVTSEKVGAAPSAENNNLPNRVRSSGQVAKTASIDDHSCRNSRASTPVQSEKLDQSDPGLKEENNSLQTNEDSMIPATPVDGKQLMPVPEVSYGRFQSTESDLRAKRSVDSSMSSMNALIDSCVKFSEAHTPIPIGDDSGMNLLASVATGEIMRSGASSSAGSSPVHVPLDNEGIKLSNEGEPNRSSVPNNVQQQNGDLLKNCSLKVEESSGGTSVSMSTEHSVQKCDGTDEQICAKTAIIKDENHASVTCPKQIENGYSDQALGEYRCKEVLNRDQEGPLMHPPSDCVGKTNSDQVQHSNASVDHEPTSFTALLSSAKEDRVADFSGACEKAAMEPSAKPKAETTHVLESCSSMADGGSKKIKLEKNSSLCPGENEGSVFASAGFEDKTECKSGIFGSKERELESNLSSKDDCAPCTANISSSPATVSDDRKHEFDLNEGLDMDSLNYGEPTTMVSTLSTAPVSLFSASHCAISSTSSALPAFITVASAAKRPFVPPEDLLRNKSELGWKGSAATSAFRPAEPRNHIVSNRTPLKEPIASKPVRSFLDFDLNLADEMGTEDTGYQDSIKEVHRSSDHKSVGFELDLNKADDSPDSAVPPVQSSNSAVNSQSSTRRNFDLNDGPAAEDSTTESYPYIQHGRGNIPPHPQHVLGMRMNNAAVNNLSSWYSPGTTYSAVTTPVVLPDISILGAPRTSSPYNAADFYRGSVLSSSPAMPFPSTPFQYRTVFPYGTSFPLPTSSLSDGSAAYMDPSIGGRFFTPGDVSNQYLRSCAVNLPDVSSNGVVDSSQKWARHGLDLNSGPLGVDAEGRDEALVNGLRQLPVINSQALMDDQARGYQFPGGVLKRKEPEGGWDRFSYKQQPSWQ